MTGLRTAPTRLNVATARQRLEDYLNLAKARVVVMVLAVTTAGFYMGTTGPLDWQRLCHLLLGTALAAGGTLALNSYIERAEDALMLRTQSRPVPGGRIQPAAALWFGVMATCGGLLYLALLAHPLAALVTAVTTVCYLFLYTPLKLKSSLCSLVGAVAGALPPVTGWVTAREALGGEGWILFAILFLWQQPHSLAIAWLYREDYARAGFCLLPVIHPDGRSTGRQVVTNCLALLAMALLPTLIGLAGAVYFVTAFLLGLMYLGFAIRLARTRTAVAARGLLLASLLYLPLIFILMALDKVPQV
jgi:protoheme IX farnesyltransferase